MLKIIEVEKIVPGSNIRDERDEEINELARSIELNGLINPIAVCAIEGGKYRVIAGHRRFEAVKRLGLPHIECQVLEELSEKDITITQIAENVQRKDMSSWELVKVFDDLKAKYHLNHSAIAAMFGKCPSWVARQYEAVRILESTYGGMKKVPEEAKKLSVGKIKYRMKKESEPSELILCKGMTVRVTGHCYKISCSDHDTETELLAFIKARKLKRRK